MQRPIKKIPTQNKGCFWETALVESKIWKKELLADDRQFGFKSLTSSHERQIIKQLNTGLSSDTKYDLAQPTQIFGQLTTLPPRNLHLMVSLNKKLKNLIWTFGHLSHNDAHILNWPVYVVEIFIFLCSFPLLPNVCYNKHFILLVSFTTEMTTKQFPLLFS